jgi:mRNA interferase MazF
VVTANAINRPAPIVVVAAVTSRVGQRVYGFHVRVPLPVPPGLTKESTILCEQLMTVSKERLGPYIGFLPPDLMQQVDAALRVALGLA